jgi:hypothetical protein
MRSFFVLRLFPTSYQFLGPYSEDQLCSEMKSGRISLSDLAYSPQDPGKWRRLIKFDHLLECQPKVPANDELIRFEDEATARMTEKSPSLKSPLKKKKAEPTSAGVSFSAKERIWYLQSQGAEFGAFNFAELGKILNSGKLTGKIYVWKEGLVNWMEVDSIEQLLAELPQAERTKGFVIERSTNKRVHVRSSIVATVTMELDGEVHTGLCLDISEGGLQVGKWSAKVTLGNSYSITVTPLGLTGIDPFTAEAVVSWVNEKSELTGFRFKSFKKPGDQKLLAKYLKSQRDSG